MDMGGHDHGNHDPIEAGGDTAATAMGGFCAGSGTVMQNGFRTSFTNGSCVLWLFEGAVLDTAGKYVAALICTFILAFANEGIRYLRARALQEKAPFKSLANVSPVAKDGIMAIGYGLQMLVAYWMMLLIMLYETVIFVVILAGLMAGYFTFNRLDNRRKLNPDSSCECSGDADPADVQKVPAANGRSTPQSDLASEEDGQSPAATAPAAVPARKSCCAPITSNSPCCGGA